MYGKTFLFDLKSLNNANETFDLLFDIYILCLLSAAELTCEFVSHSVDDLNSFFVECLRLYQAVSN